jgi:hypothetical protein
MLISHRGCSEGYLISFCDLLDVLYLTTLQLIHLTFSCFYFHARVFVKCARDSHVPPISALTLLTFLSAHSVYEHGQAG